LVVVDYGSTDATAEIARPLADRLIVHPQNRGKGAALESGCRLAQGEILIFLDADLEETAACAASLLCPLWADAADMTVAVLPPPVRAGGFGVVRWVARRGIQCFTGQKVTAPLSGQRALRRDVVRGWSPFPKGYGFEVGLTIR